MKPLLSLCSTPPIALRDGLTGPFAKVLVPFQGWVYASGIQIAFPGSTIGQPVGTNVLGGSQMVDTYQKDCCSECGSGVAEVVGPT